MNKPLNCLKLKHQRHGFRSLRVSERYVKKHFTTLHNGKACSFSVWRVTFSTRFPSLTKASWHGWGRGRGRKSTLSIQGIAAVIANGPGESIISCCARLCPRSAVTWRLPNPQPGPPRAPAPPAWSRTAEPRGRGSAGTRGKTGPFL